jgi:hypothetical protein
MYSLPLYDPKPDSIPEMAYHTVNPIEPFLKSFLGGSTISQKIQFTYPISNLIQQWEDETYKFPEIYSSMCSSPTFAPVSKSFCSSIIHLNEFPLDLQSIIITENRAQRNTIYKSFTNDKCGRKSRILLEYMTPLDERRVVNIQDARLQELDCAKHMSEIVYFSEHFSDEVLRKLQGEDLSKLRPGSKKIYKVKLPI